MCSRGETIGQTIANKVLASWADSMHVMCLGAERGSNNFLSTLHLLSVDQRTQIISEWESLSTLVYNAKELNPVLWIRIYNYLDRTRQSYRA
jgi:hypothetical protein